MASVAFIVLGQTSDVDERHQRKALLRQEIAAPVLRSDPLAELRHAAEELHLPPEEVSEVISASRAAMAPQQEAKTQLSLGASVIRAAEELGLPLLRWLACAWPWRAWITGATCISCRC